MDLRTIRELRESSWVRAYDLSGVIFLDSKYRTYECEYTSSEFLLAWNEEVAHRDDLQAAFNFFPSEYGPDRVIDGICRGDPERARQMVRARYEVMASDQIPKEVDVIEQYVLSIDAPMRLVGENQWFRALFRRGSSQVSIKLSGEIGRPGPTAEQIELLLQSITSRAYRAALLLCLDIIKDHPHLLIPTHASQK